MKVVYLEQDLPLLRIAMKKKRPALCTCELPENFPAPRGRSGPTSELLISAEYQVTPFSESAKV
jgi:hypothetical protein